MRMGPIVVTGASGFLGRHILPLLRERYYGERVIGVSSRDYDLTDAGAVNRLFEEHRPALVVHLAGYVGGIGANRKWPADFFHRNLLLMAHMFHAASVFRLRKLIYPMGGCSYPARAVSPIGESQMWEGYPQPESAAYSSAKKMGIVASEAYRQQHGLNSIVIIPGNMYGEYDNFRTAESHVVPGMIRRFYEATLAGVSQVECWGSGNPTRDFVYAGDVARCLPFFIEEYDSSEPVNISSGSTTRICELAETIRELVGYKGELIWDSTKPDGQKCKIFDVSRQTNLGLTCPTPLREGLKRTIEWFAANYQTSSDGLRL
jgi:GDP-L-fucose synthase